MSATRRWRTWWFGWVGVAALALGACSKPQSPPQPEAKPRPPGVEEALAAAEQPGLNTTRRMDHALRAVSLAPEDAAALAAVKKHYVEHQFRRLSKRGDGEDLEWLPVTCPDPTKQDACLAEAVLPGPPFTARTLERRGQDFLAIGARRDFLYVVLGTWKAASGEGRVEYALHERAFESLDVPVIRRALGLPPSEGAPKPAWSVVRGEPNSFSRQTTGSRLEAVEGERRHVAIDLEGNIPPGRHGKRDDLLSLDTLEVLLVDDFNQDGRDDALVQVYTFGNCCVPCYAFATVTRRGKPRVTNSFCSGHGPPVVGTSGGKPTFTLADEEGQKTFAMVGNEARLLDTRTAPLLHSVSELTKEQLWKRAEENGALPSDTLETLTYDLNEDGQEDRIECKGWERWSALMCKVYMGGQQVADVSGCKSLGVLPGMTRGMHDLVCDQRKTIRWDGSTYP